MFNALAVGLMQWWGCCNVCVDITLLATYNDRTTTAMLLLVSSC